LPGTKKEKAGSTKTIAQWLESKRPELAPVSFRQYKAALVYYYENLEDRKTASEISNISTSGCLKPSNKGNGLRTSSKKLKHVPEDYEKLLTDHYMSKTDTSHWPLRALAWFKATILTGLRPSEWENAVLLESSPIFGGNGPVLRVKNGKNSNGRSHGEHRHMLFAALSEEEIGYVKLQCIFVGADSSEGLLNAERKKLDFDKYYKKISERIRETNKAFRSGRKKSVTIY